MFRIARILSPLITEEPVARTFSVTSSEAGNTGKTQEGGGGGGEGGGGVLVHSPVLPLGLWASVVFKGAAAETRWVVSVSSLFCCRATYETRGSGGRGRQSDDALH